jgi:hypothetical protein
VQQLQITNTKKKQSDAAVETSSGTHYKNSSGNLISAVETKHTSSGKFVTSIGNDLGSSGNVLSVRGNFKLAVEKLPYHLLLAVVFNPLKTSNHSYVYQ